MAIKKGSVKNSYTTTKGQKVTNFKDGSKVYKNPDGSTTSIAASLPKGLKQVEKDGKIHTIREGSRADAKYAGAPAPQPEAAEVGVISSKQGQDYMKEAQDKETRLTPVPPVSANPEAPAAPGAPTPQTATANDPTAPQPKVEPPAPDSSGDFATFVNETTGQEQTLRGGALTDSARSQLKANGFTEAEADISAPTVSPAETRLKAEVAQHTQEVQSYLEALEGSLISDGELRGELSSIRSTYKARIADAERINRQRQAALTTLGIRIGSRYSGGTNGVIGSIITEEERQGMDRITALEAEKNSALQKARTEARDSNLLVYSKLVDHAEKLQQQKAEELADLKKLQAEENQKRAERARTSLIDSAISSFITQGVTDRQELFAKLTSSELERVLGGVTAKEFKEAFEALLPTGTGMIGEYEYYKREAQRMGQTPLSFDEYQTRDANRKKPITNVIMGAGNIPQTVVNQIDKLSSSFDGNQIVKNYVEVQNKKLSMNAILNSGIQGPGDLAIVFEFMKALDPTSVVREQEYANASASGNIFSGAMARFNGYFSPGGGFLPDQVKNDFASIVGMKMDAIDSQYQNYRAETARKIEMKTSPYDATFTGADYLTDYAAPSAGEELLQTEEQAEAKVAEIYTTYADQINALLTEHPDMAASDVLQVLGVQ